MSAAKKLIMIIDDDLVVLETVKVCLAHAGFSVATLDKAESAVEKVRETRPDIILLDLYMPGLGGWAVCRQLKADSGLKSIPILILSGSNEPVDEVSGLEAGAVEFVKKPIDGETLAAKIRARVGPDA